MANIIKNISVHHSGGSESNRYFSTAHFTFNEINEYHKQKWNFKSSLGSYAGYNAGYDSKSRSFVQWRVIGEETAALFGEHFDTFSLCIIGNFNLKPFGSPRMPVDPMTFNIETDVALYLQDLIEGNKRQLIVSSGTQLDFSYQRVYAHRFFKDTDCYGTFLTNTWARELASRKKVAIIRESLLALYKLLDSLKRKQSLGSVDDRDCDGFV
ncbi:MAG: hypothetical protein AABY22_26760 [Nanoarchaeota archaeon]